MIGTFLLSLSQATTDWRSYSSRDLTQTGKVRKEVLQKIIPQLKIAERCSFDNRYLIVRGNIRTYKIHLGSGNILMSPNDQYLCIVPRVRSGKVMLPFEGDTLLSIILSKALLLADDENIKDTSIVNLIGRR